MPHRVSLFLFGQAISRSVIMNRVLKITERSGQKKTKEVVGMKIYDEEKVGLRKRNPSRMANRAKLQMFSPLQGPAGTH